MQKDLKHFSVTYFCQAAGLVADDTHPHFWGEIDFTFLHELRF